jgi:outer membrane receptor protein involved in Fe transport
LLLLPFAAALSAQTSGTIRGEVVGPGSPLPGVTVTATSESRGTSRATVTGETGTFALTTLPVDTYTVEATLEGFHPQSVAGVRVGISATVTLEFEMETDTVEETIVVTAAPILDVSSSSVGTSYAAEFIEELPTARNFWDMMGVAPGVTPQDEQSIALSAFGSGITSNSWNIDGLNTTNAESGEAFWWISPDIIEEVQVLAIGAPAQYGNMSGAALNVVTKSGTNDFKGTVNLYYQDDSLTDENAEINGIPFQRDRFEEYTFSLGGPFKRDKLWYFVAHQNYRRAYTEAGENPEFPADDKSENYDAKINAQLTDSTSMEAKFHYEDWDFDSADPFATPDASGSNYGTNPAYGLRVDSVLNPKSLLEVAYSGYSATQYWMSKTGSTADPFWDTSPDDGGPWRYSGNISYPYIWDIQRDQINAHLSTHADDFLNGDHEFTFGVEYGSGLGDSVIAGGLNGVYYYRGAPYYSYYYYQYINYYYRVSARAYHYGGETDTITAFIDDSWKVNDKLTVNLGLRYDNIGSDIPDYPELDMQWNPTGNTIPGIKNAVEWEHFSPRIGFAYAIADSSVLRGFYGRFYDGNVMGNWYSPPPGAPDYLYEYAVTLDGPWFESFLWEWGDFPFDPDLKPPETDQYTLGWERQIGTHFALGIQGIYKEGKNLIGWEILDDGVYELVPWTNPFTNEVVNLVSIIEQPTTRKGNRPGPGSLAPPGISFNHDYKGAFITLNKRYADGWSMQASYTWSDSNGFLPKPTSTVQGDPLWSGTDGRDPNNWINAEQALQSEREHVLQMQGNWDLPRKFTASVMYRFLSGKPYNRQLSVGQSWSSSPLAQGTQTVIAIPADTSTSMPDQNIVDLGLARDFTLGATNLRLNLKLYNALNEDSHDWWQSLNVPPGSVYVPSGYIWPRRLMVHLRLDF